MCYGVSLLRGRVKKTQAIGSAARALLRGLSGHRYQLSYNTFNRTGPWTTRLSWRGLGRVSGLCGGGCGLDNVGYLFQEQSIEVVRV